MDLARLDERHDVAMGQGRHVHRTPHPALRTPHAARRTPHAA
jgi:hypothetical protein